MKSCKKCFEYAYVFVGGDVRICPWNGIVIGNLLENTLEEIWQGERAKEIRREFMEGNLLGCNEQYCPDCIQGSGSLDLTKEELTQAYIEMGEIPSIISLAYDERCNHCCPSCRCKVFVPDEKYKENLVKISQNIEPYLEKVKHIATNGIGDIFVSKELLDMISRLRPKREDFSIFIETNGVLFKDYWHKLDHLSKFKITVSITPNSFDRETYKYLSGCDNLEKFKESMNFITSLKHIGAINHIRMIMVIQDSNFRQIPSFIQNCIDYDADDIVLRPIFKWFGLGEDELLYKNVLNPCHIYHNEYLEILKNPLCQDKRVFNWGFDVEQEEIPFPTLEMKRRCDGQDKFKENIENDLCAVKPLMDKAIKAGCKRVTLFGVGRVGRIILEGLTCGETSYPIVSFTVSSKESNPSFWMGYPVYDMIECAEKLGIEDTLILIALAKNNQDGVKEALANIGFKNIISLGEK